MREEEKITTLDSKWKRMIRKKWVLPSIYIASAALILTGVLWYQASDGNLLGGEDTDNTENIADNQVDYMDLDAVPVNVQEETIKMPVTDEKSVVIKKKFYDYNASSEEQEAALVFYNNTYYPSTGIDIAQENGESFDVVAALSGTVVRAENDPLLGNIVEIKHEDGVTTHYHSLGEMFVEAGAQVDQGEVIGTAGTSVYNKDAGIHVHFEIRKNNEPVNPEKFLNKPITAIEDEMKAKTEEKSEDKTTDPANKEDQSSSTDQDQPNKSEQPADEQKEQPSDKQEGNAGTEDKGNVNGNSKQSSKTNVEEDASISMTRA
ncbi:M23 family metallopeptidase [Bacillus sp. P2(2020)]|uniref:M23 family metallopeptidase n=2 Tax=Calidifontibacillus erzurumensis TaxID=2741433 RepID=A0A8J8GF74_9BACI|nr:M23 family metallopeptidase [Calidifontibacillus erzurumensis]